MVYEKIKSIPLIVLNFYQKYISIFSYGSCRYYPTCSEYAKWQFEKNNIFLAFFYSVLRILRCNQLFEGGFDYPIVKIDKKKFKISYTFKDNFCKLIKIKYWYIPIKDNKYIIIKNQEFTNVTKQ